MSRVLRLPGLGIECHVTEHALERYAQRVRPHLEGDLDALAVDLRRMVQTCGATLTLRPEWVRENWTTGEAARDSDLWVHCGDIAFAVSRPSRRARATMTTVLIRGGISEQARAHRNRKRSGRTYRKRRSKRDPHERSAAAARRIAGTDLEERPVPQANAAMITDLQASSLNPFGETAVAGGQQIHLHLTVDSRTPDLDGLVAAITTFYGGATKVTNESDRASRGIVRLRVIP